MKKIKILLIISFGIMTVLSFMYSSDISSNANSNLQDLISKNVAMAEDEDCPGGDCTYTFKDGSSCSACCQEGKKASCTVSGCNCT